MEKNMEKRIISRKKFRQPISFDLVDSKGGRFKNFTGRGFGVDISEGGIGMTVDRPLKKDKVVRLLLPVLGGKATIPVFSIIRWAESAGTEFRVGLQFLV